MRKNSFFVLLFLLITNTIWLAAENFKLTKLGDWGSGPYRDIAVQGDYAFCIIEDKKVLDVIDVSDTRNPIKLREISTGNQYYKKIFIQGNAAFLIGMSLTEIGWSAVFSILDISNSYDPRFLSIRPLQGSEPTDIFVMEKHAYVTQKGNAFKGLSIFDISQLSAPKLMRSFGLPFVPSVIHGYDQYILAVQESKGISIIDISNPGSPKIICDFLSAEYINDLFIKDHYAHICSGSNFLIYDIQNPYVPQQIFGGDPLPYSVDKETLSAIQVQGDYAYIISNPILNTNPQKLNVLNISNHAAPIFVSSFDFERSMYAATLCVKDSYVYLACHRIGMKIVNLKNKSTPKMEGSFASIAKQIDDVLVQGKYSYLTGFPFRIIDISNPFYPIPIWLTNNDLTKFVVLQDHYAYCASSSGFDVYDIANPGSPQKIGSWLAQYQGKYYELYCFYVSGEYAYFDTEADMLILNISNPEKPLLAGRWNTGYYNPLRGIHVRNNLLYAGAIKIWDVSVPTSPKLVADCQLPNASCGNACLQGNIYAAADPNQGVWIFDVSNPAAPFLLSSIPIVGGATDVKVQGQYAYVGTYSSSSGGLQVYDISVPSRPIQCWNEPIDGYPEKLHVTDNYVYAAASKLHIFRIGDPTVEVTSPNGGETLEMGNEQNIKWNNKSAPGNINIGLYRDHCNLGNIAENIPGNSGNYSWLAGTYDNGQKIAREGSHYRIGIMTVDGKSADESDGDFQISSGGIRVNLAVEKKKRKAWIVENYYGLIQMEIKKTDDSIVNETYILLRKEEDQPYQKVVSVPTSNIRNGSYTYYDKYLKNEAEYTYYIQVLNSQGSVIAISAECSTE